MRSPRNSITSRRWGSRRQGAHSALSLPDAVFDNGGVGLFSSLEVIETVEISLYLLGVSAYARGREESAPVVL